jgi:hypothetical protein
VQRVRVAGGQVEDWWTLGDGHEVIDEVALRPDGQAAAVLSSSSHSDRWLTDPG